MIPLFFEIHIILIHFPKTRKCWLINWPGATEMGRCPEIVVMLQCILKKTLIDPNLSKIWWILGGTGTTLKYSFSTLKFSLSTLKFSFSTVGPRSDHGPKNYGPCFFERGLSCAPSGLSKTNFIHSTHRTTLAFLNQHIPQGIVGYSINTTKVVRHMFFSFCYKGYMFKKLKYCVVQNVNAWTDDAFFA